MTSPKKSKIPYFFFAFFAVIFTVNFSYIYISQKSWRGIVTEDSYRKGLQYNLALKSAEKQKNLGWKMEIKYSNFGKKFGAISIKLKDKNRSQISDAILYVNFKRPTQEGFDFTQKLQNFDGIYKSDLSFPLKGQWDFEVVATKGEYVFQEVKRYVVQ